MDFACGTFKKFLFDKNSQQPTISDFFCNIYILSSECVSGILSRHLNKFCSLTHRHPSSWDFQTYEPTYYPPSTTLKGDIETVSVRLSVFPSVRPKRKSSHSHNVSPILTKFLQHLYITENFYTMYFHKKWQKLLPQPFFFLSFNTYLPMFVPYMNA